MYTGRFNVTPNKIVMHTANGAEIAQHVNNTVDITLEGVTSNELVQLINQFVVPMQQKEAVKNEQSVD